MLFKERPVSKKLRFTSAILTSVERKWLEESSNEEALRFRRLKFLLDGIPGDERIEVMIAHHLLEVMSSKVAYKSQ